MPSDLPLNTAHKHAANADDHVGKGMLLPAVEEHQLAAEAYMSAHANSQDESTKRTLRLLHERHKKVAAELQRKIDHLRAEGKDPSLPQTSPPRTGFSRTDTPLRSATHSPSLERQLADTVDESFMILQGGQKSDPADSFNQFWNVMQKALDSHLSQGVAFATIPLGNEPTQPTGTSTPPHGNTKIPRESSQGSDTDADEPIVSRFTKGLQGLSNRFQGSKLVRSSYVSSEARPPELDLDLGDGDLDDGDLSDFILISSDSPNETSSHHQLENATLKVEVEALRKQLQATERHRKEQETHLRDSLYQVTREAHRAFTGRSQILESPGGLHNPSPVIGVHSGREAQYYRRVQELDRRNKELEEELRAVRVENEKNKAMNAKFRERWDKLKDSARRKKELKVRAEVARQGSIEEDREAEERLDTRS